jgi:hydroxypyruvate isomerase
MPKFCPSLSMMFTEVDFLNRFASAARAGFTAVEYMFPYEYDRLTLRDLLREHRLTQVLINLPAGNWAKGERGIACHPDRTAEFADGVERAIEYAGTLGCGLVNCLTGIAPAGVDQAEARSTFVANLQLAAKRLKSAGVKLLIEPVNTRDIPGFFLNRTSQAVEIIEAVGSDNLFLQYDVYHMQVMEGDLSTTIKRHLPLIKHIQIADPPARSEPGTGEINFNFLFSRIDQLGYQGWIGCEYKPAGRTEDGLNWVQSYLTAST